MSGFNATVYTVAWNALTERQKERVKAKATWEHITVSAAFKWLFPGKWKKILKDSEPVMKKCVGLRG